VRRSRTKLGRVRGVSVVAAGGTAGMSGALGSALRLRFTSLPTRIIVSVFSAALVTGLAVTLIATGSTERFLRSKIDERFPALLQTTAGKLERWYAQRELDIDTFASSETLAVSLRAPPAAQPNPAAGGFLRSLIGKRDGDRTAERARDDARRYLAYVQEGFPQYHSLFVLDPGGVTRVSVGADLELASALRRRLADVRSKVVSGFVGPSAHRFQVISTPIERRGKRLGTLHAVIMAESVERLLSAEDADPSIGLYVIEPDGKVLARSPAAPERSVFERTLPASASAPRVEDYTGPDGVHVVSCAMRFGRFDWILAIEQEYDVAFAPVVAIIRQVLAINTGIVLVLGFLALLIARSIVQPIRALSDGARRIAQGDTDVDIPKVRGQDEIGVLSGALQEMVDRLRSNQIELERKQGEIERANKGLTRANEDLHRNNEMLEQLSITDGLTHLHNHRYFQDRLRLEVKRCDRSGEPLALLLVDIDDFKSLNDQHGHAIGDEVLARVASLLNSAVRETDLLARYGGEEFAVLAPRTQAQGAIALGEKLRREVREARFGGLEIEDAGKVSVTVSVGVALYEGDPKRFFNEADRALYQAKGEGKDCVVFANEAGAAPG
jgi:diguanylate cyclase (GGDEF)-like protein